MTRKYIFEIYICFLPQCEDIIDKTTFSARRAAARRHSEKVVFVYLPLFCFFVPYSVLHRVGGVNVYRQREPQAGKGGQAGTLGAEGGKKHGHFREGGLFRVGRPIRTGEDTA